MGRDDLVWGWGVRESPVCPALPRASGWALRRWSGSGWGGWSEGGIEQLGPGRFPGPVLGQVEPEVAG